MRWFKCPSSKSKSIIEARKHIGDAGLWQIACLVEEAHQQDIWDIDAETIVGWIKVKRDRAERILPFAQEIFRECLKISGKSQKISSKSEDFTPSKPHGSTRDLEENRIEENIPPVSPPRGTKKKQASRISENWEPDEELLAWALGKYPTVETGQQTERFKHHFLANGKPMLDWRRAWQNWIARSLEFSRPNPTFQARPIGSQIPGNRIKPAEERTEYSGFL